MLLCLLVLTCAAEGQEVITSPPAYPVTPPALQPIQAERMGVIAPAETTTNAPLATQPFQWGPLDLRPHFLYRFLYGDGIQASAGHPLTTAIYEISPGLLLDIGSHWTLDYTPTWSLYSNRAFRDTLDHNVVLAGGTTYEDWAFGLSQSYARTDQPLIETGGQTLQETYLTAVNASYRFGRAISLELGANQNFTSSENFTDSSEWSTLDWLSYQFWPRFDAGLGAGFGYVHVNVGHDSVYEQYQGRINWRPTDKISLQVHGGVEDRQFYGAGTSDLINPIYGAAIQYQPFEVTALSLSATRTVSTSPFENQVTEDTDLSGSLNQRLLKRFNLSLGAGYHTVKYVGSAAGVTAGRKDEYYSFNVRLSTTFLKRGTIAASYQFSDNSSNQAGFGYSSNQVGLEVGYQY